MGDRYLFSFTRNHFVEIKSELVKFRFSFTLKYYIFSLMSLPNFSERKWHFVYNHNLFSSRVNFLNMP